MSHACLSFSFSWFQLIGGDQQRGCQLKCLLGVEPKALIGQTQTPKLDSVVAPKGVLRVVVYGCGECPRLVFGRSEPLPVKIRVESVSVAVAIVAKAVIVACSNFARIRVRVATGRPVVAGRAVGIAAPVGLHVGTVLSIVSRNMDLGHGSDD